MPSFGDFFKSLPRMHVPSEWVPPSSEDYQQALYNEGFITPERWTDDDISEYPLIQQDLNDLEEYLLPVFWDFNQKSRHYQNRFYLYQWIFMIGAFVTTILAVLATYFSGFQGTDRVDFLFYSVNPTQMAQTFSLSTMIVSAITSYFTILSNQGSPRKRWASYRRLAEELRMTYFSFLSRLAPFDTGNRLDRLRVKILEIREKERESV